MKFYCFIIIMKSKENKEIRMIYPNRDGNQVKVSLVLMESIKN